ncbi:MAG: hypothetical protein E6Q61_03060 [Nitrosomonas sp.]|nr:MAG: hypothetical protein E6Q61_03060 [Nitrosomonas sp.]HMW20930.1 hypothetical protein [Nitrosomonas sp.]HMY61120.1 hypothetical protein [Nitrosomonas sp.]HMY89987.1 hypothetical protein [Nitrosomonas sp.]HND36153.1 hypothetical protein [Nitrosomonas sp.]
MIDSALMEIEYWGSHGNSVSRIQSIKEGMNHAVNYISLRYDLFNPSIRKSRLILNYLAIYGRDELK